MRRPYLRRHERHPLPYLNQPPRHPGSPLVAAALSTLSCTAVSISGPTPQAVTLAGVIGQGQETALRDAVQRAAPGLSADIQTAVADGPYCPLLDLVRPYAQPTAQAAGRPPIIALPGGRIDLIEDELVRPRVTLPGAPSHLQLDYFASDGGVLHMHESKPGPAYPASATPQFGDPRAGFPGWGVYLPFGTDLIVAVASSTPLFAAGHTLPDTASAYVTELRAAMEQARRAGPVAASVLLVRTAPKR